MVPFIHFLNLTLTLKTCSSSSVTSSVSRLFPPCRAMTFSTFPTSGGTSTTPRVQISNQTPRGAKQAKYPSAAKQRLIHGPVINAYLCQWTWHHTARPPPPPGPPRFVSACKECWLLRGAVGAARGRLAATSAGGCEQTAAPNPGSLWCFQTLCRAGWWFYWGTGERRNEKQVGEIKLVLLGLGKCFISSTTSEDMHVICMYLDDVSAECRQAAFELFPKSPRLICMTAEICTGKKPKYFTD